jgi:hypothetical protein
VDRPARDLTPAEYVTSVTRPSRLPASTCCRGGSAIVKRPRPCSSRHCLSHHRKEPRRARSDNRRYLELCRGAESSNHARHQRIDFCALGVQCAVGQRVESRPHASCVLVVAFATQSLLLSLVAASCGIHSLRTIASGYRRRQSCGSESGLRVQASVQGAR